jgi:SAM-dependent methyltransferase
MEPRVEANIERWRGFAAAYDRHRPAPPAALLEWLLSYAYPDGLSIRPLVVDLGAGTGLSTFPWMDYAGQVVGVEPSDDMIRVARAGVIAAGVRNIHFVRAFASDTGLPDRCADIVTCSQCLHWLDPDPTFAEVARLLRPGGVLAAYDYDWPPASGSMRADAAYATFMENATHLERTMHIPLRAHLYAKKEHLSRMRTSGRFAFCREFVMHSEIRGDAERFIELTLTQGAPATLRKLGVTDEALGVTSFRREVRAALGATTSTWLLGYRVRMAITGATGESD